MTNFEKRMVRFFCFIMMLIAGLFCLLGFLHSLYYAGHPGANPSVSLKMGFIPMVLGGVLSFIFSQLKKRFLPPRVYCLGNGEYVSLISAMRTAAAKKQKYFEKHLTKMCPYCRRESHTIMNFGDNKMGGKRHRCESCHEEFWFPAGPEPAMRLDKK